MTCFVLNLERDRERLEKTKSLFAPAGVNFERINAVDAHGMSAAELRAACPLFRFYLANARRVKAGEIGCALSHRKAWETVVERSLPFAAMFEDDVLVDVETLKAHLAAIEAMDDPSIPTVWLMNRGLPRPDGDAGPWYDIRKADGRQWVWGAYCYALNSTAAERLVKLLTPIVNVCDAWSTFARCGVRVLAASDAFATTRSSTSTIKRKTKSRWRYSWYRRFYWFRYRFAFWLDIFMKRLQYGRCPKRGN